MQTEDETINTIIKLFPSLKSDFVDSSIKLSIVLKAFENGIRRNQFVSDFYHMCDDCKKKSKLT